MYVEWYDVCNFVGFLVVEVFLDYVLCMCFMLVLIVCCLWCLDLCWCLWCCLYFESYLFHESGVACCVT